MKTNDFERLLRDAALQAQETMVSDFTADDTAHSFSPVFEEKMDTLRRRQALRPVKRVMQQAACIALVLLMGGTLWLGTDAAARETFLSRTGLRKDTVQFHYLLEDADHTEAVTDDRTEVRSLKNYVEVNTLSECRELLREAQSDPDSTVDPEKIVHCKSSAGIGYYAEEFVDSEYTGNRDVKACSHGGVGLIDIRYVYRDYYHAHCTLCDIKAEYAELRKGYWTCRLP